LPRQRILFFIGSLMAIMAVSALWTLFSVMDNRVGFAPPFPTPDEQPSSSTFNILRVVGEDESPSKVGDVIVLPPGVDTDEEKLAYLQSLGNPSPTPSPTPSIWPAAARPPGQLSVEEYLQSRGIDPLQFALEIHKGDKSFIELVEEMATR
jgi:hypothetical protein